MISFLWNHQRGDCTFSEATLDAQFSAQQPRAVIHRPQTVSLRDFLLVETLTIILKLDLDVRRFGDDFDSSMSGVRVAQGIGEAFLNDGEGVADLNRLRLEEHT